MSGPERSVQNTTSSALDMDTSNLGEEMYRFVTDLFPICRSITGQGVRETLSLLQKHVPVDIRQTPSGTRVFDWIIPKEWNIRLGWIKDPTGKKIIILKIRTFMS